jgi:hypothetical protein
MKNIIKLAIACTLVFTACKKDELPETKPAPETAKGDQRSNMNGSDGIELVYYDGMLVKMNSYELSEQAAERILDHNKSLNILYEADGFITVTDAIQGDEYNPLWQEVEIEFNSGFTPHQFFDDEAILEAAEGTNPEITLVPTDEVYRCSILQPHNTQ